jgi:hypothetical protein
LIDKPAAKFRRQNHMSEEALRRFLARLKEDAAFRESMVSDPENALVEFELSPAERVAITSNDEDALRRLAGLDVSGFSGTPGSLLLCPLIADPRNTNAKNCSNEELCTIDCPTMGPCRVWKAVP